MHLVSTHTPWLPPGWWYAQSAVDVTLGTREQKLYTNVCVVVVYFLSCLRRERGIGASIDRRDIPNKE